MPTKKNISKTLKKRSSVRKTRRMGICEGFCCDATMHGLQKWYEGKFEKLGWMVLANEKHMSEKISEYKHSIGHLEKAIQHKLDYHACDDNKDDLMIMLHNVNILKDHVEKDFE
jgi:hypothetical protein